MKSTKPKAARKRRPSKESAPMHTPDFLSNDGSGTALPPITPTTLTELQGEVPDDGVICAWTGDLLNEEDTQLMPGGQRVSKSAYDEAMANSIDYHGIHVQHVASGRSSLLCYRASEYTLTELLAWAKLLQQLRPTFDQVLRAQTAGPAFAYCHNLAAGRTDKYIELPLPLVDVDTEQRLAGNLALVQIINREQKKTLETCITLA